MLHEIQSKLGRPKWCGPGAIAIITGKPYDDIDRLIANNRYGRRRKRPVQGTYKGEVATALSRLGWSMHSVPLTPSPNGGYPTLGQWMQARDQRSMTALYLVNVTHHWVVAKGHMLADNHHAKPLFWTEFSRLRRLVKEVWLVQKHAETQKLPRPAPTFLPVRTVKGRPDWADMMQASRYAKMLGGQKLKTAMPRFLVPHPHTRQPERLEFSDYHAAMVALRARVFRHRD